MITKLEKAKKLIGNTPLIELNYKNIDLYAKLEYNNYSGSIKDRAAYNIISEGIKSGKIKEGTQIIESSSGNFAIALATLCKTLKLKFTAVIDPNINKLYEDLIRLMAHDVIKVDKLDKTGGYLLTRINTIAEICAGRDDIFWPNQYENPDNYKAYYKGLGNEICEHFEALDYIFIGVSSCGTITGLSRKIKEKFPDVKVVAVDVEGSVIFNTLPKKRTISGIGASKRPSIIEQALIDHVVHVSEKDMAAGTNALLNEQCIFAGASSGASYWAIKEFFKENKLENKKVLFLCPDKGFAYMENVYNANWKESMEIELAQNDQSAVAL